MRGYNMRIHDQYLSFNSLRSISDAIVVGIGTVLNEDPGLNGGELCFLDYFTNKVTARIPTLASLSNQPTPVIIDPHLRTPLTAKVISNYTKGVGKAPIVLTLVEHRDENNQRALEGVGVRVERVLQNDASE